MKSWPNPPDKAVINRLRTAAGKTWRRYSQERRKWMNEGNGSDFRPEWVTSLQQARVAAEDAAANLKRAIWFSRMGDRDAYDAFMRRWGGREGEIYLKAVPH